MDLLKVPVPQSGKKLNRDLANQISEYWAKENNTNIIKFIASGEWGQAYQIEDNKVLKVTVGIEEAAYAYEAMLNKPKGYVSIYDVKKINESVFIIVMDLIEQPKYLMEMVKEIDDILDSHSLEVKSDPKSCEDLIENDETLDILFQLNEIATGDNNFPMNDIHYENVGFKLGTTEIIIIDQMFENLDKNFYQEKIKQMN